MHGHARISGQFTPIDKGQNKEDSDPFDWSFSSRHVSFTIRNATVGAKPSTVRSKRKAVHAATTSAFDDEVQVVAKPKPTRIQLSCKRHNPEGS
ncbi:hypothetical protein V6N13_109816 [Hibiscus sabdariffa]|uniref:Uncharacterized protein n=1 Tax=Hibiscus sabdariffa TaxID=183260 RepID=A0ABR2FQT7_9ROSI